MTRLPVQHRPRLFFPELSELFEGFPSWASLRPVFGRSHHSGRGRDEATATMRSAPRSRGRRPPRTSTSRCVTVS
jgi:hypothetical protein